MAGLARGACPGPALGLVAQVSQPGLGQFVTDGGVHRGLLG